MVENKQHDYQRIAQAIAWLQANYRDQPSLADAAASVHLSEYHFQRLFTRWAGISPKRFIQFLTAEYARTRLAAHRPSLDAALDAGLSGTSRLHSLFCAITAMTPAEYRDGGRHLTLTTGITRTPFGACVIAQTPRGICHLRFIDDVEASRDNAISSVQAEFVNAQVTFNNTIAVETADKVFTSLAGHETGPLSVHVKGTNFQLKVWEALLQTAPGDLLAYSDVAVLTGQASASRACGTAIAHNPIACLIPCHRVIRTTGVLGNYRWGDIRKQAIIGWEAAHRANTIAQADVSLSRSASTSVA